MLSFPTSCINIIPLSEASENNKEWECNTKGVLLFLWLYFIFLKSVIFLEDEICMKQAKNPPRNYICSIGTLSEHIHIHITHSSTSQKKMFCSNKKLAKVGWINLAKNRYSDDVTLTQEGPIDDPRSEPISELTFGSYWILKSWNFNAVDQDTYSPVYYSPHYPLLLMCLYHQCFATHTNPKAMSLKLVDM